LPNADAAVLTTAYHPSILIRSYHTEPHGVYPQAMPSDRQRHCSWLSILTADVWPILVDLRHAGTLYIGQ